jgi:UDP-glucose 6-dehydrogenase
MENCYLAMKVIFMNQFYEILKRSGSKSSWEEVAEIFHYDSRMGNSHYNVPGPDGDFGFGGKCVLGSAKVCVINRQDANDIDLKKEIITIEELYNRFKKDDFVFIESCDAECEDIEYKQIIDVTRREIDEELLVFETENGPFACTQEHLMPILRNGKIIIVEAKNIKETDKFFSK